MDDTQLDQVDKPVASSFTGRHLKPGKHVLEVREAIVGQEGISTVTLQSSLFFADWQELKEYLKEYVSDSPIKKRVP